MPTQTRPHRWTHRDLQTQTDTQTDAYRNRHRAPTWTHAHVQIHDTSQTQTHPPVIQASLLPPHGGARRRAGLRSPQTSSPGLCHPGQGDGRVGWGGLRWAGQASQGHWGRAAPLGQVRAWGGQEGAWQEQPRVRRREAQQPSPHPTLGGRGQRALASAGVFPPLREPAGEGRIPLQVTGLPRRRMVRLRPWPRL